MEHASGRRSARRFHAHWHRIALVNSQAAGQFEQPRERSRTSIAGYDFACGS